MASRGEQATTNTVAENAEIIAAFVPKQAQPGK